MAAVNHDVFNGSSAEIFPNDFSSSNEVEKRAQLATQAELDRKKACQDAEDFKALRVEQPLLKAQKRALETQNRNLEARVASLEAEKQRAERILEDVNRQRVQAERDYNSMLAEAKLPLEHFNNLDPALHDRYAQICLTIGPHTAIDLGGNNGGYPHGWTFELDNGWQRLKLSKVDPSNCKSPWLISVNDIYLEFADEGGNVAARNSRGRRTNPGGKEQQEWYIGHISWKDGFMLQNVRYENKVLDMADPTQNRAGKALRMYNRNENDNCQVFQIVLK